MRHAILAACMAALATMALPARAHGPAQGDAEHPETVTPLFEHALPNVPGKALSAPGLLRWRARRTKKTNPKQTR